MSFSRRVYSKVVLCGEHSVLRGGLALVMPFKSHFLEYTLEASEYYKLCLSEEVKPYELLISGTMSKALSLLNIEKISAKIGVKSLVPLGKGLGGSAALSVFVAHVMNDLNLLKDKTVFGFAVDLEHMFHGESSGLDIAGCLAEGPQSYLRGQEPLNIIISKDVEFKISLHLIDEVGQTESCIDKVLRLKSTNRELFNSLDEKMNEASFMAKSALEEGNLKLLSNSFNQATEVFQEWGLITDLMKFKSEELLSEGALAVKPTGSGMGGGLLALWPNSFKIQYERVSF